MSICLSLDCGLYFTLVKRIPGVILELKSFHFGIVMASICQEKSFNPTRLAGYETENILLYQTSWKAFTSVLAFATCLLVILLFIQSHKFFYEIEITVFSRPFQIFTFNFLDFTLFCFTIWGNIMHAYSANIYT